MEPGYYQRSAPHFASSDAASVGSPQPPPSRGSHRMRTTWDIECTINHLQDKGREYAIRREDRQAARLKEECPHQPRIHVRVTDSRSGAKVYERLVTAGKEREERLREQREREQREEDEQFRRPRTRSAPSAKGGGRRDVFAANQAWVEKREQKLRDERLKAEQAALADATLSPRINERSAHIVRTNARRGVHQQRYNSYVPSEALQDALYASGMYDPPRPPYQGSPGTPGGPGGAAANYFAPPTSLPRPDDSLSPVAQRLLREANEWNARVNAHHYYPQQQNHHRTPHYGSADDRSTASLETEEEMERVPPGTPDLRTPPRSYEKVLAWSDERGSRRASGHGHQHQQRSPHDRAGGSEDHPLPWTAQAQYESPRTPGNWWDEDAPAHRGGRTSLGHPAAPHPWQSGGVRDLQLHTATVVRQVSPEVEARAQRRHDRAHATTIRVGVSAECLTCGHALPITTTTTKAAAGSGSTTPRRAAAPEPLASTQASPRPATATVATQAVPPPQLCDTAVQAVEEPPVPTPEPPPAQAPPQLASFRTAASTPGVPLPPTVASSSPANSWQQEEEEEDVFEY